ncbi:hypothetical protein, partial [Diplocloster agilis]
SVFTAALCVPREIQKNPAARSVPGYRLRFQAICSGHTMPPGRMLSECGSPGEQARFLNPSFGFH